MVDNKLPYTRKNKNLDSQVLSNQIGNLSNKTGGRFNAKEYGVVGDNTPMAVKLQQAFDALSDGDTLEFPNGDYLIDSVVSTTKAIKLKGLGKKVRFITGTLGMTDMLKIGSKSNEGSLVTLTVAGVKGQDNITASSVTGISRGDYILIQSDERVTPVDSPSDWRKGEIVRVRDVDTTNKVLTFYTRLFDSYGTAFNAGYRKINMLEGVSIEDITFINPYENQTFCQFLQVFNCTNVYINNIKMKGGDKAGLTLWNVIRSNVNAVICEDFVNNQNSGRYGYGISVERASQQLNVTNCHFARCRHGFTTNGGNADPYRSGIPRLINVSNCTSVDGSEAQFDTHPIGEYITFDNCSVQGARYMADPYGDVYGESWGFQIRSNKTRLINPQVNGTDIGILVDIYAKDIEIINPTITDVTDVGIRLYPGTVAGRGYVSKVRIRGGNIINSGTNHILIGDTNSDVSIIGTFMDGAGKAGTAKNAIDVSSDVGGVRVIGATIIDTGAAPSTDNGIRFNAGSYNCVAYNNYISNVIGSRVAVNTNTAWTASTAYTVGQIVANSSGLLYKCTVAGTSGSTAPSHTSGTATDGTVTWQYRGKVPLTLSDVDDLGISYLPHNLVGGRTLTQFDVGTEGSKPLRLNRNSTGDIQVMGGTSSPVIKLTSNGKVLANSGLGVGNSATATTLGSVAKKMEVFDASGNSLGFVPIYSSIT